MFQAEGKHHTSCRKATRIAQSLPGTNCATKISNKSDGGMNLALWTDPLHHR